MKSLIGIKRDYRAASFALLSAVVGVIVMRLLVGLVRIPVDGYGGELLSDALFSLPVQLLFFLTIPFLIYKLYGRRSVKEVLGYSSVGGFKPYYLLALPIGFCVWILTLGVSSAWSAFLDLTGYNYIPSNPPMPQNFSFGFFIAEVAMTAVLPAVCEEFCMRGGVLTTARTTLKTVGCIVFCGVAFGLFHQNIRQVFYTMLFGAFAAFLTLRLKSIYPAMLAHFANNFCSVYFDYADNYDFAVGGRLFKTINALAMDRVWALALAFVAVAVVGGGLTFIMLYLKERKIIAAKKEVIKDSAFDVTNKRVVLMGEFDAKKVETLEMEKEVYGAGYEEEKFRPSLRDISIVVALGAVTLLTTVFTYVWGFFY